MVKNLVIGALATALAVSLILPLLRRETPAVSGVVPGLVNSPVEVSPPVTEPAPEPQPEPLPSPDPIVTALEEILDEAAKNPALAGAAIGFCLVGPDGEILVDRQAEVAQIPASSLKTLTTATALEVLGADFKFQTRLGISAPADELKPEADLVLLGGGDPMLSLADLEDWAKGLAEAGVKSIPGRVIGDGRFFAGSAFADFWNWGDIGNGYGSPVAGLNLGHNRFTAVFEPGEKEGDPTKFLGSMPDVPGVSWWNETLTAAEGTGDGVVIHGGERTGVMFFRGTVPMGSPLEVVGAIPDPERFAAHHLREALLAAGIEVAGEAIGAGELFLKGETVPVIAEELLVHQSPPLLDIVTSIHATSDNHETECLYRMIGLQAGLPSDEVVRSHWRERGLDLVGLRMVDGSGLARADHITPASLARLQQVMATGPLGESYVKSLLEIGEGKIRFKAGAMSAVRSYTGLVEGKEGPLAFALMANHYADGEAVRALQVAVFDALGSWETEEEPAEPEKAEETPAPTVEEKPAE